MHGNVPTVFARCRECGREAAFNLRTRRCTVISCGLYYEEA